MIWNGLVAFGVCLGWTLVILVLCLCSGEGGVELGRVGECVGIVDMIGISSGRCLNGCIWFAY